MKLLRARLRNRYTRIRFQNKALNHLARTNLTALDQVDVSRPAQFFRYVVVDTETTGPNRDQDQVISVGAVRLVDGKICLGDVFNELVNPGRKMRSNFIKIHGIVPDMVATAKPVNEVFQAFLAYLGTDILVGHNVEFDLFFLNKAMRAINGFCLQNLVIDTVPLYRTVLLPPHRYPFGIDCQGNRCDLDSLAKQFDFEIQGRHTALGDALATAMLLQRVLAILHKKGRGRLCDLVRTGALL